jgi:predicted phage terminase large subunit-like protein
MLSAEEVTTLLNNLHKLSDAEKQELLQALDELERRNTLDKARKSLLDFIKMVDTSYKVGAHHKKLARLLEAMERGEKLRIAVNIAPRFGKSQLTSIYFPAWFIGNNPTKKIMLVSHTADLAVDFGRKVRNLIATEEFRAIFPDVTLAADSKSAGRWSTNKGGEFFAVGIGGAIAGRGADFLCLDDPHNEQDIINGNYEVFEKAYEWYTYGARTRLMPEGRVAVVMCMTGDTPVLMADGTEKRLDRVQAGDEVATYDHGAVATAAVLNWQCSGVDPVYEIRTTCGIVVRANERHPFLVDRDGELTWVRLKNLNPGDLLVSLKGVAAPDGPRQNQASVLRVSQKIRGTVDILTRRIVHWGIMGSGKVWSVALKAVLNLRTLMGSVGYTATGLGLPIIRESMTPQSTVETSDSNTDMALPARSTMLCLLRKLVSALFVNNRPLQTCARTGGASCVSIMTTRQEKSVGCCATTATSLSATGKLRKCCSGPLSTLNITRVKIADILFVGDALVYDVAIDRTENFIANGLVSHNTRWAQNDLTGKLLKDMVRNPEADQWELVEFPALLDKKGAPGEYVSLWPEQWSVEALLRTKASMPPFQWSAQYMQNPTSAEAAIIKREWWQQWEPDDPPTCEYVIVSMDTASETKTRSDYTSITTWGIFMRDDERGAPRANIILLNAIKDRYEFPDLKRRALEEYKAWQPDWFVVEKRSSGVQLFQELRSIGIPVQEYMPHRGTGDKTARLNSVADIFASGLVWYPAGRRWAEDVVEEVCGFPNMEHDDQVDSTVIALLRFRNGGFLRLPTDAWDSDDFSPRRAAYY